MSDTESSAGDGRPPLSLFPLFLDLAGRTVVVTGAGERALGAARRLLDHGAAVRLVASDPAKARPALEGFERAEIAEAAPDASHLDGAVFLVCASEDPADDAAIREAAQARPLPVAALSGEDASAFLGHVRPVGPITLAVTTAGLSPELEARLVDEAARSILPEHGRLAEVLSGLRERLAERYPDEERRHRIWAQLLDESSPVLPLLQSGDEDEALELAERMAWGTG